MKLLSYFLLVSVVFLATQADSQSVPVTSGSKINQTDKLTTDQDTNNSFLIESFKNFLIQDFAGQKVNNKLQPAAQPSKPVTPDQLALVKMSILSARLDKLEENVIALEKNVTALAKSQSPIVIEIVGNNDNNRGTYAISPSQVQPSGNILQPVNHNRPNSFFAHTYLRRK